LPLAGVTKSGRIQWNSLVGRSSRSGWLNVTQSVAVGLAPKRRQFAPVGCVVDTPRRHRDRTGLRDGERGGVDRVDGEQVAARRGVVVRPAISGLPSPSKSPAAIARSAWPAFWTAGPDAMPCNGAFTSRAKLRIGGRRALSARPGALSRGKCATL
jgi:hypothetical protein